MCTEDCGQLQPPDEQELIEAFEIAINDAFAFLGPEHQLEPSSLGVFDTTESGPQRIDPTEATYPFLAVQELTGAGPPVRITYGERSYHLGVEVGANGSGYHSLENWLTALDVPSEPRHDSGVSTPTALARHARGLAKILRDHFGAIRTAGPEVIARLGQAAPLHRNREEANRAFADGDYATYLSLLESHEDELTATEQRKVKFATDKISADRVA